MAFAELAELKIQLQNTCRAGYKHEMVGISVEEWRKVLKSRIERQKLLCGVEYK